MIGRRAEEDLDEKATNQIAADHFDNNTKLPVQRLTSNHSTSSLRAHLDVRVSKLCKTWVSIQSQHFVWRSHTLFVQM